MNIPTPTKIQNGTIGFDPQPHAPQGQKAANLRGCKNLCGRYWGPVLSSAGVMPPRPLKNPYKRHLPLVRSGHQANSKCARIYPCLLPCTNNQKECVILSHKKLILLDTARFMVSPFVFPCPCSEVVIISLTFFRTLTNLQVWTKTKRTTGESSIQFFFPGTSLAFRLHPLTGLSCSNHKNQQVDSRLICSLFYYHSRLKSRGSCLFLFFGGGMNHPRV